MNAPDSAISDVDVTNAHFRAMFAEHDCVMLLIEPTTGDIIDANESACGFYGYGHTELRALNITDINMLPPEQVRQCRAEAVAGTTNHFLFPHRLRDGRVRTVEVYSSPILTRRMLFSIIHDVTEAQADLDVLIASEEHYRLMADQISDVVVRTDAAGVVRWVSPSVTAATGWRPADLEGTLASSLLHPDDRDLMAAACEYLSQKTGSAQFRMRGVDGVYRWFDVRIDPLPDTLGEVAGYVASCRNTDDEVRAREALHVTRDRLSLIIDASRLGTWDWNMVTGEVVVNDRWAEMLGYQITELEPISIDTWADLLHPEDLDRSNTLIDTHSRGFSEYYETECRMRHRDGLWVWVLDRGRIVQWDAEGTPTRMTGTHQDITDRKEAEQLLAASEARYRALVERMVDTVVALDPHGRVTFASPSLSDLLGWDADEWIGRQAQDLVFDPADLEQATEVFRAMLDGATDSDRLRLRTRDGGYRWIEASVRPQPAADGTAAGIIAVWRDVTAAVEREQEAAYVSAIAAQVGDVVMRLDQGVVAWVSPSISTVLGGQPTDWVGVNLDDRVHPGDASALAKAQQRLAEGLRDRTRLRLRDAAGDYHWVDVVTSPATFEEPSTAVLSMRVIDDDVAREGSLRQLAGSDSLTGLANRRELMNAMAVMLSGPDGGAAVIFCDLDRFKELNDSHGHAAGDAALVATASRLQASVRPDDLVARIGGDEFVVLLKGVHHEADALSAAERIRKLTQTPIRFAGASIQTSLSMGVAIAKSGETPGPLLQRADDALYAAKRAGRNRTVVSPG